MSEFELWLRNYLNPTEKKFVLFLGPNLAKFARELGYKEIDNDKLQDMRLHSKS